MNDLPPMTCDRLRELLVEHVDGLLGASEAGGARAHLAFCADCRLLQEEVRRNFTAMDAWEDEELPAGAWERLDARLSAGPVARAVGAKAAGGAGAPAPVRRSWVRLALPYAAGLATAAAAALVLVFLPGDPPGIGPAGPGGSPAPVVSPSVSPSPGPAAVAVTGAPLALRPGERKLSFEDVDRGVVRTLEIPRDLDPSRIMLVDTPRIEIPEHEVR